MLSYEDCLGLADLTEAEVDAIAQHEHLPEIVAVELGSYLVRSETGVSKIERIILDDVEAAQARGKSQRALHFTLVLKHFVDTHPQNACH